MPRRIDYNASSNDRLRRNMQKIGKGDLTEAIKVTAPLTNSSTALGLALISNGGLAVAGGALGISTALSTTAPLTGGGNLSTGLTISIPLATSTANGYLSSTDWTTLNSKQPAFTAQGSTQFFAGPSTGANALPTFRRFTNNDFPSSVFLQTLEVGGYTQIDGDFAVVGNTELVGPVIFDDNVSVLILSTGHIIGRGSPIFTLGSGAGTGSPTKSITGGDTAGLLTISTGTAPLASAVIGTIGGFFSDFPRAPFVTLTPANANASALGSASPYVTTTSTSAVLNSGAAPLAASTQYQWFYHILG